MRSYVISSEAEKSPTAEKFPSFGGGVVAPNIPDNIFYLFPIHYSLSPLKLLCLKRKY
jgi:hypothetical protein